MLTKTLERATFALAANAGMGMDLKAVDVALGQWRDRLLKLSRNVSELTELPEYVALRNRFRGLIEPPLSGRTAEETGKLVASGDELALSVSLLGMAIDRADAARSQASPLRFNQEACARQAQAILDGDTIEVVLADVPVLDRDALGGAQDVARVSPMTLLGAIQGAYKAVSATLREVSGAEQRVAEMLKKASFEAAGMNDAECTSRLGELEALAKRDPLGAAEEAEKDVLPRLAAARTRALSAQAATQAMKTELDGARAELRALSLLARRAADAADACRSVVTDAQLPDPQTDQARELPGWLDRIADKLGSGNANAVRAGLASWRMLLASVTQAQQALEAAANAAVARREDMRGRYGALRAKHQVLAARGGVEMGGDETAERIRTILFGKATPLLEAERLLAGYEAMLARSARLWK
jgi:hypothetical protein